MSKNDGVIMERQSRLQAVRSNQGQRIACETVEERDARLQVLRRNKQLRTASERVCTGQ